MSCVWPAYSFLTADTLHYTHSTPFPSTLHLEPVVGESVGWVILEAMAMALPVISTAVGAVGSFVKHGETGFLMQVCVCFCVCSCH